MTYEIAGLGGFLSLAQTGNVTDKFGFSVDFGRSFQYCDLDLSTKDIVLHNFLTRDIGKNWCCRYSF
jgi:hypothetical protein